MPAAQPVVQVDGLRALSRDLTKLGDAGAPLIAEIKKAAKTAAQPVLVKARSSWPLTGIDHKHHDDSLRISPTKTGATIREGGKAYGGTGWLEFGGYRRQPRGGYAQRDRMPNGRYLFPAAQGLASTAGPAFSDAVQQILDRSSVWTNSGSEATAVHD